MSLALAEGCSASDSGGASPLPNSDASTSGDSGTGFDASPSPEASFDANACQPGDISDFKPTWKMPTAFHQGACPPTDPPLWEQFRKACLGAGTKDCAKFTD